MAKASKKRAATKVMLKKSTASAPAKKRKKQPILVRSQSALLNGLEKAATYERETSSRPDWKYANYEELVLKSGKPCIPQKLPTGVKRGKKKYCFRNAYALWQKNPNFTYVEGYALSTKGILPVLHAWVVDENNKVIDNTWDDPESNAYFGIAFDIRYVNETMERTRNYGVLCHYDDAKVQEFLRKGLPQSALKKPHVTGRRADD